MNKRSRSRSRSQSRGSRKQRSHGLPSELTNNIEIDPFDEGNFVEKIIDVGSAHREAENWSLVGMASARERKEKNLRPEPSTLPPSSREYNKEISSDLPAKASVTYEFGDRGSDWRMMKLRSLRAAAQDSGRDLEDLAFERYGSLDRYDEAREEEQELLRRKSYGVQKTVPTGSLYQQRLARGYRQDDKTKKHDTETLEEIKADDMAAHGRVVTVGDLNSMQAKIMKAKLINSPNLAQMENEYQAALHHYNRILSEDAVVVLPSMDSRGQTLQKDENEMTIEDIVREEKRESRGIAQSRRDADRIAKDSRYKDDLDYQDENADRLAARIRTKEINLKNVSINEFKKLNKILDNCPLCHKNDGTEPPIAPVVSLGTRVFLSLPSAPLVRNHCLIVPLQHRTNVLECDDDEQEEIRNFMKSLTRFYDSLGFSALFYENNARPHRRSHCAVECIPIPHSLTDNVPRFWEEAILAADEEWAQHRPIIRTEDKSFYRKMSSSMPYFHVWFNLNGGLGHIIEDDQRWPKDDLFGREVVASILGLDMQKWRRKGTWTGDANTKTEKDFKKAWDRWDWTKALLEP